jgi:hypothetical protein
MSDFQGRIEIHERLAKIETKLDQVLEQTRITNGRVTVLEMWKARLTGKAIGISAAVGFIVSVITWLITLNK